MEINEYAQFVLGRRIPPAQVQVPAEVFITVCGLVGELGEVLEHLKKHVRDGKELHESALKKEMGDVLFYWCRMCDHLGLNPASVIEANIAKLTDRAQRGVERGSGDDR
jgi:MazG nucleotide pyrophosphohydrolase domain.